jgi:hypothetical protein
MIFKGIISAVVLITSLFTGSHCDEGQLIFASVVSLSLFLKPFTNTKE